MVQTNGIAAVPAQKVIVINGNAEVLGMLDAVLDAGRYDMVFVESSDRAYSQVRRVLPNLVILCTTLDDMAGFHLLTMLKLDVETRNIPVLTCTTEGDGRDLEETIAQFGEEDDDLLPRHRELRMN